jgi:NAD(P)-dependent dehydrogenase (short-subunit alcohol dehydrogenase family)
MGILDRFSLKGKVVLITGGAGLYGRQIVAAAAEAGAQTYIAARHTEPLDKVAQEHRDAGRDVRVMQFDQGDEASVLALRDAVVKDAGRVDVLVNNAVLRPMKKAFRDEASTFAESMRVNATGLFVITRAIGDVMAEKGCGSIINIGSIQGMIGPDPTIYRGTSMSGWYPDYFYHKGAVINFTRFIASFYGARGVRCNCVSPGGFRTPDHPDPFVQAYSDRTFLGRLANSTDLMGIIVFLGSDASEYITGANIPVDGGYTAK